MHEYGSSSCEVSDFEDNVQEKPNFENLNKDNEKYQQEQQKKMISKSYSKIET